jgi:hypothetical protein
MPSLSEAVIPHAAEDGPSARPPKGSQHAGDRSAFLAVAIVLTVFLLIAGGVVEKWLPGR